jgi:uncharacterized protein (DUF1800 family)
MTGNLDAAIALSRFGLGARDSGLATISSDPRAAVRREVTDRQLAIPASPALRSTPDLLVDLFAYQRQIQAERERKGQAPQAGSANQPMPRPREGAPMAGGACQATSGRDPQATCCVIPAPCSDFAHE